MTIILKLPKRILRHGKLNRFRILLRVETLEDRAVPSATPTGLSPGQIRNAYGFDQLSQTGANQTIAIVDAYDHPSIGTDLANFDEYFNLTPSIAKDNYAAFFEKATPQGTPKYDSGWAEEIALDVEWAHAIAPQAKILLVEAKSNSFADLMGAVDYAVGRGATVVSMSWGSNEFSTEASYDSHFLASGVTFVASSGDYGKVSYPAVSPYVVGVGGTALSVDSSGNYQSEKGWGNGRMTKLFGGSGGGISAYEAKPNYQKAPVNLTFSSTKRTSPDVAFDADPNTGVSVYFQGSWVTIGGTSAGAPQWAGLFALANQARADASLTSLTGSTQTLPALYNMGQNLTTYYHDITSGSTGTYTAKAGYDLVTGLGTPRADKIVPALADSTITPSAAAATSSTTQTATNLTRGHRHDITPPLATDPNVGALLALGIRNSFASPAPISQTFFAEFVPVTPISFSLSTMATGTGLSSSFTSLYLGGGGGSSRTEEKLEVIGPVLPAVAEPENAIPRQVPPRAVPPGNNTPNPDNRNEQPPAGSNENQSSLAEPLSPFSPQTSMADRQESFVDTNLSTSDPILAAMLASFLLGTNRGFIPTVEPRKKQTRPLLFSKKQ